MNAKASIVGLSESFPGYLSIQKELPPMKRPVFRFMNIKMNIHLNLQCRLIKINEFVFTWN